MEDEDAPPDEAPPQEPAEKGSPKRKVKKSKGGNGKENKGGNGKENVVAMPPCGHAWCFGEVLRKAGIESGVCCPKALPWGQPARLKYLPGWDKPCRDYLCKPMRYGTPSLKRNKNGDVERRKTEAEEAKLLWSYLAPIFQFPKKLVYEDEEETKVCQCLANKCQWAKEQDDPPAVKETSPPANTTQ